MRRLRVVLHAHSDWSYDGHWPLPRIARLYGRLGIDAVMMTEHDSGFPPARFAEYRAACAEASTPRCTLVPGIEYSSPENDIHILSWGMRDFLGEHRPVLETLRALRAAGGVAVLAHPVRRAAWRQVTPEWLALLDGIELWNRKSDGISWGTEALDLIAAHGLPATVGHDFHRPRHLWPLSQQFTLPPLPDARPETLETALVAALRRGESRPMAFGRPLRGDGRRPSALPHPALERARRRLRDLRDGRRR
jgi:hypothetical protein